MIDQEALQLREGGASYSAIARQLELRRATDAHGAFIRALHSLTADQRQQVIGNEERRLNDLENRIRERDAEHPEKLDRRLEAVGRLRESLG